MMQGSKKINFFKKTIAALFLTGIITACNNDSEVQGPLNPEEAEQELENMGSEMANDIASIAASEGYKPIEGLMQKLEQDTGANIFARKQVSGKSLREFSGSTSRAITEPFVPEFLRTNTDGSGHERFDFEAKKGVYVWNATEEKFERTEDNEEKVIVKFPAEGADNNNAIFTITNYQDVQIKDEYSSQYYPTVVNANLTVDGTEKISLSYQVTWKENGIGAEEANIELFLAPYTFTLTSSDAEAKASTLDFKVLDSEDNTLINFYFKGLFKTESKEQVASLETNLQYRTFNITGDVDVAGIQEQIAGGSGDGFNDVTALNEFINLTVNKNERKIGDVVIDMNETTGEPDVFVQFTDDSKKSLQEVLAPVIAKFKDLTEQEDSTS